MIGNWSYVLSPRAVLLYSRLSEFPLETTTLEALAALISASKHQTKQALQELERHGFLSIDQEIQ